MQNRAGRRALELASEEVNLATESQQAAGVAIGPALRAAAREIVIGDDEGELQGAPSLMR
jgi:hypothetical protein